MRIEWLLHTIAIISKLRSTLEATAGVRMNQRKLAAKILVRTHMSCFSVLWLPAKSSPKMYAQKKGWNLEGVRVSLSTRKVHAKDCEDCESDLNAKVDIIDVQIQFEGDLDEIQENRLLEISERCPVHRTLTSEVKIRTRQGVQTV